ncbi:MAG: type II secretion system protein GspM [SAR86 cluster bacterium]|nr:type II secretion system protein GspM [SAR86 cluster bacterium]
MKDKLKFLTRKEQIILISFILFISVSIFFVLNSWFISMQNQAIVEYYSKKDLLIDVKRALLLKSQIKSSNETSSGNLSSKVSSLARTYSLSIDRIQPVSTGEVMISVNNTKFINLYKWLKDLEEKNGITAIKVSIRKNAIKENTTGVKAQLVLKAL